MIVIYTDGLAEPNPGLGTYGYAIYKDGQRVAARHGFVGESVTNNYAEYESLVRALREARKFAGEEILVRSDSKLLVNQMGGEWKVRKGGYVERYAEAKELAGQFRSLRFEWIPREENTEADELSRVGYAEHLRRPR
jgi:ribonuclease HI